MVVRRHELTSDQWGRIEGLLPSERGRPGRPAKPNRKMVNGIVWILRTGAPWRDLPKHYGPWKTVHNRFLRWSKNGVWAAVLGELCQDLDNEMAMIDGSYVRVHQDAVGGKKKEQNVLAALEAAQRPRFMRVLMHLETQRRLK